MKKKKYKNKNKISLSVRKIQKWSFDPHLTQKKFRKTEPIYEIMKSGPLNVPSCSKKIKFHNRIRRKQDDCMGQSRCDNTT